MTLLRRVLGETLRGRRLRQRRTLREVSGAARVSLGYLSEVERGQKEASSELLASICEALDVKLSDLLREVSETMRRAERAAEVARMPGRVVVPAPPRPNRRPVPAGVGAPAELPDFEAEFDGFDDAELRPLDDAELRPVDDAELRPVDDAELGSLDDGELGSLDEGGSVAAECEAAGEQAGVTDQVAVPPAPATQAAALEVAELDGVDLAELETGDGLGEVEILLGLTDLAGREGPHAGSCLAAAAA
jgi:XRE family transcriptional regulator, stress-response regulator